MPIDTNTFLSPQHDRIVARRWEQIWRPQAALLSRAALDPAAEYYRLSRSHDARLRLCLSADIREITIAKYGLDSPLSTPERFQEALRWAVDRRDRRAHGPAKRKLRPSEASRHRDSRARKKAKRNDS